MVPIVDATTGARRNLREFPAPMPKFDPHRSGTMATSMALARQIGLNRAEAPHGFHNVIPPRLGTTGSTARPVPSTPYSSAPNYFQPNYTFAPVQMHPREGTIFVNNVSISIPSDGIPRPGKRSGESIRPNEHHRRTEQRRQYRRSSMNRSLVSPHMECIEIDMDDDE